MHFVVANIVRQGCSQLIQQMGRGPPKGNLPKTYQLDIWILGLLNIPARPLTQSKGVSFVTLWGGRQVDYFVSLS